MHLGFVCKPPKRGRKSDAVNILLERTSTFLWNSIRSAQTIGRQQTVPFHRFCPSQGSFARSVRVPVRHIWGSIDPPSSTRGRCTPSRTGNGSGPSPLHACPVLQFVP